MKTRAELKEQARFNFSQKYWPVVGISFLGMLIVGATNAIPGVGGLIYLLVGTIIVVGLNGFFLSVYRGYEIKVENLFSPFNRYGRVLGGMLWMYLWLFIWALIFIVPMIVVTVVGLFTAVSSYGPALANSYDSAAGMMSGGYSAYNSMMPFWGDASVWNGFAHIFTSVWLLLFLLLIPAIIKSYAFFCTPYILADSPNVPATDAIRLSQKIMAGYKWKLFVTQLTFLGWILLSAVTAGILWIFYVGPYYNATMAGFYEEVKNNAKNKAIPGVEILN